MARSILLALVLGGCSSYPPAVCVETADLCPFATPDGECGGWRAACDGPEFCFEGDPRRVYLGDRPTCPGGLDDSVAVCPDGSEAFCVFIPGLGDCPLGPEENPYGWCD